MEQILNSFGFTYSENYKMYENKNTYFGHILLKAIGNTVRFIFMNPKNEIQIAEFLPNKAFLRGMQDESVENVLLEALSNILSFNDEKKANELYSKFIETT